MDVRGLTDKQIKRKMKDAYYLFVKIQEEYEEKLKDPDFKKKWDEKLINNFKEIEVRKMNDNGNTDSEKKL